MLTGRWVLLSALFVSLFLVPFRGAAQAGAEETGLRYPVRTEAELLVSPGPGLLDAAGIRATFQRRLGLRSVAVGTGLYLTDPEARVLGAAVGGALTVDAGPVLVEPFLELGVGLVDARIDSFGYRVREPDGGTGWVHGYADASGVVPGLGAGVAATTVLDGRYAVRLTAGYWRFRRGDLGLDGLRVGVGVGLARRDDRWYALQLDTLPPVARVPGAAPGGPGTLPEVVAKDGAIEIMASDASGIAEVRANHETLETWPVGPGDRAGAGPAGPAARSVVARYAVTPPIEGAPVWVVVRDSAGRRRELRVLALPAPDVAAPAVYLLPAAGGGAEPAWASVRAAATDASGIARATLDRCPLTVARADPATAAALALDPPLWILSGGAPRTDTTPVLTVHDPAGHATRLSLPRTAVEPPAAAGPAPDALSGSGPRLRIRTVRSDGRPIGGRRSVRVDAQAVDASGIARVTVEGHPAVLHPAGAGEVVVHGWVEVDAGRPSVVVTAVARDGRETRQEVAIEAGRPWSEGRLRVLPLAPVHEDALAIQSAFRRLAGIGDLELDASGLLPALAGLGAVETVAPGDAVLLYVAGWTQGAPDGAGGPALALPDVALAYTELTSRVRAHAGRILVIATDLRPTRGWTLTGGASPGATAPPGCVDPGPPFAGGVLDLGAAPADRIASGLGGAADTDGDGVVRAGELAAFVGAYPAGWLPYDPFEPLGRAAGRDR